MVKLMTEPFTYQNADAHHSELVIDVVATPIGGDQSPVVIQRLKLHLLDALKDYHIAWNLQIHQDYAIDPERTPNG